MSEVAILSRTDIEQIVEQTAVRVAELLRVDPPPDLVDKKGLAEYRMVSESTVDRWRKLGMPYEQAPGAHPRFRKSEVDRWLYERVQNVSGEASQAS